MNIIHLIYYVCPSVVVCKQTKTIPILDRHRCLQIVSTTWSHMDGWFLDLIVLSRHKFVHDWSNVKTTTLEIQGISPNLSWWFCKQIIWFTVCRSNQLQLYISPGSYLIWFKITMTVIPNVMACGQTKNEIINTCLPQYWEIGFSLAWPYWV